MSAPGGAAAPPPRSMAMPGSGGTIRHRDRSRRAGSPTT
ncbi:MAG: hypothetical protein AVDCRST_MAG73-769 [uncultured Thermomicrobiales bacterium]|uniref:Uncharacterized protein n=1 Tax=uncultured Thermomicrobiales bacterium TaxID=1645740 RepID=A0A6J4TRL8_9BACT|nr:MAG: hypothetical protein AVDCRST_MAG73-769 [uncultured Thermomicrobiales bacterium]